MASRRSRASRRRINSGLLRSSYLFGIGRWKFHKSAHSLTRSECCYRGYPRPARACARAPQGPQKRRCSAENWEPGGAAFHFLKTHHALPATSFRRQCLHGRDGHATLALARFGRLGGRPSSFLCTSRFLKLWILSRGIGEAIFGIFEALFDLLPGELFGVSIGEEVV